MTFWKVSDKRINCKVTQQEMQELGFDLMELQKDQEKAQEFLGILLKNARKLLDVDIENGVQNFVAAMLPDQSVYFSISCVGSDEEIDNSLENIQETLDKLQDMASEETVENIKNMDGQEKMDAYAGFMDELKKLFIGNNKKLESIEVNIDKKDKKYPEKFCLVFQSLDIIMDFCKTYGNDEDINSELYKFNDSYVLILTFSKDVENKKIIRFMMLAEEFNGSVNYNRNYGEFVKEHGMILIDNNVLQKFTV